MNNTENHNDEHESIEDYLPVFLNKYNAGSINDVNCAEISEADFESLGDAVMESNHPGEAHRVMDQMMGGEGSERLAQMHINMGQSYLRCDTVGGNEVGNMGYMMGGNYTGWAGMPMMNSGFGYLLGINSVLISVLLVVLIRYFWKKGGGK